MSYVYEDSLKINAFCEDGKPCYEGKSPSGHIWWDICDCVECKKEETLEEDYSRRRKKRSTQQILKERYEADGPKVDHLGEPFGRFDYYVLILESEMLGSKDLGFYVFRTLMCIVGKP